MINKNFIILLPLVISTEAKRNGEITAYQLFRNKKNAGDFSTPLHSARNDKL